VLQQSWRGGRGSILASSRVTGRDRKPESPCSPRGVHKGYRVSNEASFGELTPKGFEKIIMGFSKYLGH